ncbi:MAG: hypothetical protein V1674_01905 [Candidatus Omnitrophota bacterium]
MLVMRLSGLFTIIPATVLLTVSFFVLFTLLKIEPRGLKKFGYVVCVLLWICAALLLCVGLYILITGQHPMMRAMQQMMKMQGVGSSPMMQHPMMNR